MSGNESHKRKNTEVVISDDHWLCKMEGYLVWRVIGPRINNPYEITYPDRVLLAMSKNRDLIRSHMKVRCLSDGHEVLSIDNLSLPLLTTDHPCLIGITRKQVLAYLEYFRVEEEIERTIDRVQEEVAEELQKREMIAATTRKNHKTIAQIRAEREAAQKALQDAAGSQVRVVRG